MGSSNESQLPSFDTLRSSHQWARLTRDAQRLFWTVDGPLKNSIWIMKNTNDPDSLEPYYADGNWHLIAQMPLTEPKISSITVHVDDLDNWEENWYEAYRDCSDSPDDHDPSNGIEWGVLPDYDSEEDEEGYDGGSQHLLMCCGVKRPRGKKAKVVVKASEGSFVTVHDYVSVVHPWLMSLRDDILEAMGLEDGKSLPSDTKLMVGNRLDMLKMYKQAEWIQNEKGNAKSRV
ncbi:hypothetical protein BP6252_07496 [Coleophoma cylindrospora]|uniref:Uncharacterized protein n=1 Tax=Coleophoma cylindrospora TaxID=1849047 RepID=A0A3D8RA46_9HELO|nr:hypothetical protein BP6252_07496 [Coleophoma cylindrospora]